MGNLDKNRASEITQLHNELVSHLQQGLEKAIRIGELLTDQKTALKHGEFTPWARANLPFTDRTARNYMRLFRERDRLKTETVSDLKSAYGLLAAPKQNPLPLEDHTLREELTLYDEDTICMQVEKRITDKCRHAILHPIKMDTFLAQYLGDHDIGCTDIFEIIAIRGLLTVADYMAYIPLKIAANKAEHRDERDRLNKQIRSITRYGAGE